jgi:5'-3' exoribonuclease 2
MIIMGIPTYLRKILKDHTKNGVCQDNKNFFSDHFYIDFNAMIYSVIIIEQSKIEKSGRTINSIPSNEFETILLNGTIEFMKNIICDIVRPHKSIYIAVDGPPPMAKIIKQRARRYKSVLEYLFKKELETKYKIEIPHNKWSSASISPGCIFLDRLSKEIRKNICNGEFLRHIPLNERKNFTISFNDYNVPGEGEHKLLNAIVKENFPIEEKIVVYSPDADLIVLLLMTGRKNMFIFREEVQEASSEASVETSAIEDAATETLVKLATGNNYMYLSIDKCRECFLLDLMNEYSRDLTSPELFLKDYCFLTFLCGNDFVTASPFLRMKEGGLDILLKIYKNIFSVRNCHLITVKNSINMDFFKDLIKELSIIEEIQFQALQRKRDRVRKGSRSSYVVAGEKGKEDWKIEFMRFQHEDYYSPVHPKFEVYNKLFDSIDYYNSNWINSYNKFYFSEGSSEGPSEEYFKSLQFCLDYYINSTTDASTKFSWTWYYPFRAAPTFKDFYEFLEKNFPMNKDYFPDKGHPLDPFEQLLMILPRSFLYLLPKCINEKILNNNEYDEIFPKKFSLDVVQGLKFIYSEPLLPDPSMIPIGLIKSVELNDVDKNRNTLKSTCYIYKSK